MLQALFLTIYIYIEIYFLSIRHDLGQHGAVTRVETGDGGVYLHSRRHRPEYWLCLLANKLFFWTIDWTNLSGGEIAKNFIINYQLNENQRTTQIVKRLLENLTVIDNHAKLKSFVFIVSEDTFTIFVI